MKKQQLSYALLFFDRAPKKSASKTHNRVSSPKISASEKLKQDVISIMKKKEKRESSDSETEVKEVKPSTAVMNELNSDAFKQRQFKSTANRNANTKKQNAKNSTQELSALNPTLAAMSSNRYRQKKDMPELSIFNDKFFIDEDEKFSNWLKRLAVYRKQFFALRKPVLDEDKIN